MNEMARRMRMFGLVMSGWVSGRLDQEPRFNREYLGFRHWLAAMRRAGL